MRAQTLVPLQAALGELAYKSEIAERLRLDLRGQTAKFREAEERYQSTQQALEASEASQQALEQKLKAAGEQLEKQRGLETRLMVWLSGLPDFTTLYMPHNFH